MRRALLIMASLMALALLGACEPAQEGGQQGTTQTGEGQTAASPPATQPQTTAPDEGEQVTVGGFTVEGVGSQSTEVPEVTVSRDAAREYLRQVQPVVQQTASDISETIKPRASIDESGITLGVDTQAVRQARDSVRDGLDRLEAIDPPSELQPINEELITAYENSLPAYNNIIEAAESGEPQNLASVVEESLPQIEQFNNVVNSIVQDLQRATQSG